MAENEVDRRDFLKLVGAGAAAFTTPTLIGCTAQGALVQSEAEYGGFVVEQQHAGNGVYQYDPEVLQSMKETMTIFSRNEWDPARQDRPESTVSLEKERLVDGEGKIPNQTRLDYALQSASWATAGMEGLEATGPHYKWTTQSRMVEYLRGLNSEPWDPADLDMTWDDARLAVKHAALFYGASLAGIAELNPLWLYSDHHAPTDEDKARAVPVIRDGDRFEQTEDAYYIPASMNRVVALAFEEDYHAIANSPGRLASAAVGNGYSRMANTAFFLAEFLRCLGYRAIPAGNGVGLSVPIAIDAGLGEYGRMGLLMTPKYGPRVRIAKVITDMPLTVDAPIRFGVREFCEVCMLCATHCPSATVPDGDRTWEGKSASNNPGTLKWYGEMEKCYDFNGFSCSNCKRVCPFNKPNNSWLHQMTRKLVEGKVGAIDELMVKLDQAGGYGAEVEATEFWARDGSKSITAREKM